MKSMIVLPLCMLVVTLLGGCAAVKTEPVNIAVVPANDTGYTVQAQPCKPYDLKVSDPVILNCYVENSRFQSMVNPEKMLPEMPDSHHPSTTFELK